MYGWLSYEIELNDFFSEEQEKRLDNGDYS